MIMLLLQRKFASNYTQFVQLQKAADEAKEKGNACMKEKNYIEGMLHYTEAIKRQPNSAALYSNRCHFNRPVL